MRARRKAACLATAIACLCAIAPQFASATFPGRPGLIVFNLTFHQKGVTDYTGGLFAFRPGWSHARQLTDNPWDHHPSFAPNGERLVFRRVNAPQSGLFTLDLASGRLTRITSGSDTDPAFGPGGTVVFARFSNESGSNDLFLRSRNGRLRRLTSTTAKDLEPVFAPDGERILFVRDYRRARLLGTMATGSPRQRLFSLRTDGTGLQRLRAFPGLWGPDIAPDGRRLAFEDAGSGISTAPLRGGRAHQVSGDGRLPTYSPDGAAIAYANHEGLWRRPSTGGPPSLLFPAEYDLSQPESVLLMDPAWQPLP